MSKQRIAVFTGLAILPVVLALWLAGFDVSYQLGNYVVSDNATVMGEVYQASAPAAGQIGDLYLDVGDPVQRGQGVANLITASSPTAPLVGLRTTANVRSPAPGTIVHVNVVRGQSVTAGQSVAMVADLSNLWVEANVDETSFKDLRSGMPAEVKINALDRYFRGSVVGVVPDLTAAQAAAARTGGAGTVRPIPQVPVRIAFDYGDALVYPGMTASVKIFTR